MTAPEPITTVSFWFAALLPIVYLPILLLGVDSTGRFGLLVALLVLNVIALVLGHDYPAQSRPH